jgi:hypothetical protein
MNAFLIRIGEEEIIPAQDVIKGPATSVKRFSRALLGLIIAENKTDSCVFFHGSNIVQ